MEQPEFLNLFQHPKERYPFFMSMYTFDEDFNIPDAKPDVGSVLLKQADAVMEELRQLSEKVIIKGRLDFEILYAVEGSGRMKNLSGALTFEESRT